MRTIEKFIEIIENYVEADEIKSEDSFKLDLGMSSFDTVCMVEDIREEFDVELTVADFINNKTVGQMAEYISSIINE